MSSTHTDLVIQISASEPGPDAPGPVQSGQSSLVSELTQWLRAGAEVALVFRGYIATTSVLWLSGPLPDGALRAGVRLIGVSAPVRPAVTSSFEDGLGAPISGVASRRQTEDADLQTQA